jgi:hypothetical protein
MPSLQIPIHSGSLLQFYQALWGPIYEAHLSILGTSGIILPIGDRYHGQPDTTKFKTMGGEQVEFTWSEAPSAFDTGLDLTAAASYQGIIPVVTFNGTNEEADTPDAAYWSRDDSGSNPVSMGAWVNMAAGGSNILAKYASSNKEWRWLIDSNRRVLLEFTDESAGVVTQRRATTGNEIPLDQWAFVVATYDSAGGSAASDTVILYRDGVVNTSAATNNGSYVAMENLGTAPQLGVREATDFFNGKMAGGPLGPFFTHVELTPDQVLRLYELGRRALML